MGSNFPLLALIGNELLKNFPMPLAGAKQIASQCEAIFRFGVLRLRLRIKSPRSRNEAGLSAGKNF